VDAAPRRLDALLRLFDRAAEGRSTRRLVLWGTALVVGGVYVVLGHLVWRGAQRYATGLSLIAVMVLPLWAACVATVLSGTAVAAEAGLGTLDALRLLPMTQTQDILKARYLRRRRVAFFALFLAVPLYLLAGANGSYASLFITSYGRLLLAVKGVELFSTPIPGLTLGPTPVAALAGPVLDATRVYAAAAISMAVSLRMKNAWDGLVSAALATLVWISVAALAGFALSGSALLFPVEAFLWHVYVPRRILRYAWRNWERWHDT